MLEPAGRALPGGGPKGVVAGLTNKAADVRGFLYGRDVEEGALAAPPHHLDLQPPHGPPQDVADREAALGGLAEQLEGPTQNQTAPYH